MTRREFIVGVGAVAAWTVTARAQQPSLPAIGVLRSTSFANTTQMMAAFRLGLKETGFIENQNVAIEYYSAEGQPDRLRTLVVELIGKPVAVIVANSIAALAAKAATTTIPIVFGGGADPVTQGLVTSLNRPGGNVTGVTFLVGTIGSKRLELLRQLVPRATTIGMVVNPNTTESEAERRDVQDAAQAIGQQLIVLDVSSVRDIEAAFATLVERGAGALIAGSGTFLFSNQGVLVALAARHSLPAIYNQRQTAEVGGLMSYGTSQTDAYRQVGIYTGRILKGEKPADLPVIQSSRFEFVINLKTAKTLGLEFHPQLLATADEVIE